MTVIYKKKMYLSHKFSKDLIYERLKKKMNENVRKKLRSGWSVQNEDKNVFCLFLSNASSNLKLGSAIVT